MKTRFGVVGHGFAGSRHVPWINRQDEAQCIAVCDIDPSRFEGLDQEIKRYPCIDEIVANPDIDVVVVASPNKFHKEHVIKAANAGKHVICEKPVAMSLADFDEMAAATRKNGVTFTVHQQRRLDPDFQTVKAAYDQGLLGRVYLLKSVLYGFNGYMHDWHVYKSEGGGMLLDWGVHLIDQILYLVKSPLKAVFADVRSVVNFEVDDYFKILLRFQNGVTAEIELGTYMLSDKPGWFPRHWYMCGDKGSLYVDKFEPEGKIVKTSRLLTDVRDALGKYIGPTRSFGEPDDGLILVDDVPKVVSDTRDYYVNYLKALRGKEPFLVTLEEARQLLQVLEAVRESATQYRSISFA